MRERERELRDQATGKNWSTRCDDASVLVRTGFPGKEKETLKSKESPDTALAWAEKEEWSRLKKGFILDQPHARPGEPRMHRFRVSGFTGALAIEDVAGKLLCNAYDSSRPGDQIFLLDESATKTLLPAFPANRIAWKACYMANLDRLLVKADHQVVSYKRDESSVDILCAPNRHPVSCLHTSGTRAVWYEEPDLVVRDLDTGATLMRLAVPFEMHGNHSPQMEAALSPDGTTVACCAQAGKIEFFDVATGQVRDTVNGTFAMLVGMTFTPDGAYLILIEQYGNWETLCVDLSTMAMRQGWPRLQNSGKDSVALSADGARMAIVQGRYIEIVDFHTLRVLLRFRVDHMIKRSSIAWVGKWLGVQTDYGCASLYALDP